MQYNNDNAIESPTEDLFERKYFAYYLARGIHDLQPDKSSYVIGILGKWGEGKTSTINMALKYLKYLALDKRQRIDDIDDLIKKEKSRNINKFTKTANNITSFLLLVLFYTISAFGLHFLLTKIISEIPLNISDEYFLFIVSNRFVYEPILASILLYFLAEKFTKHFLQFKLFPIKITKVLNNSSDANYVQVWFEPWNYTSKEQILKEFFKTINTQINNSSNNSCLKEFTELLNVYAKLITQVDISLLTNIFGNNEIKETKDKINECLKICNKKIIVVIDNIDRLLPEEELLIFQTVKLLADFPNVIYLLSFDKEKVCADITTEDNNGEEYIKKIIQLEKNLPIIDENILENLFIDGVKKIIDNYESFPENKLRICYNFAYKNTYIKNIRDLNKFLNAFTFAYSSFKSEKLSILDLISIIAIEVFDNSMYYFIIKYKTILCSSSSLIYDANKSYIYPTDKEMPMDLNEFAKIILNFDNLEILQIIFPNLFTELYKNIKKEENDKKEINSYLFNLAKKINYEKLNDYLYIDQKESYRRLSSCSFFDNYFRSNLKIDNIKNETIQILNNCIQNTSEFNNRLFNLFNKNSNLVADYIDFWNSNFNIDMYNSATKNLIENLLTLEDDKLDLINFLDDEDLYCNIINGYRTDKISRFSSKDIFDIISNTITLINNKIMFFLLLIYKNYVFPVSNTPISNGYDKEGYFPQIIELLEKHITYENLINDNHALKILYWMFKYLNCETFVVKVIDKLLNDKNATSLLSFLLTDDELFSDTGSLICKLFNEIKFEDNLKEKLLDIYYNPLYESYKTNDKYFAKQRYKNEKYIVEIVLDLYYGILITKIKTDSKIDKNNFDTETKASQLKIELEKYKFNEIKYAIQATATERQSANTIKYFLDNLKNKQPDLYEKYHTDKFDLFINLEF